MSDSRLPILYLAPWVDFGGSDKGTIDWFRTLDRSRFAASLITTQPSANPRLAEIVPHAEEVWELPDLMLGERFARFILDFIVSREIAVVHVMNSRLGFDLLPDVRALAQPPKVVVQLHVEEPSRDGYVRYVTSRYGNLVDAFSVSSEHLADAVWGYGIPRGRIAVIPTGVDGETEFAPERVEPWPGLEQGPVRILYPGRLVAQKDPLLMVEVARELARRGLDFVVHAVGEGDLEADVRARVEAHGLRERVLLEPPTRELARWYRAVDLMLMTSRFEGVPYAIYEALAMGVPVVAPALPGNVELMGAGGGMLIERREQPGAYADALEPLIEGRELRERIGAQGRERMLAGFSLRAMADAHADLYTRIGARRPIAADRGTLEGLAAPVAFAPRGDVGAPLVSIVTPCFDDGRRLAQSLQSVAAQTHAPLETIVVDDGSSDGETLQLLAELERDGTVIVIRLQRNGGPGAARNRGIERARGRYILPLDADNLLVADAVATLVAQLEAAPAEVGFVYQNLQFFGTREDYMEVPAFNPWLLTRANFVDTCALLDRGIFERGLRYPEDMPHGHEDWDFACTLAEHGVRGEPAGAKTLLYGKHGFSRSDSVEWVASDFHADLASRHPRMFAGAGQARGDNPQVRLKARWAPALSVIALAESIDDADWRMLLDGLRNQRLRDFELHAARADGGADESARLPPLRAHVPAGSGALADALALARGRNVLVTAGSAVEFLADPGGLERIVRLLEEIPRAQAAVFVDAGGALAPFSPLDAVAADAAPHALAWSRRHEELREAPVECDEADPLGTLARWLLARRVELGWRHLPAAAGTPRPPGDGTRRWRRSQAPARSRAQALEQEACLAAEPCLPGLLEPLRRWATLRTWMPAGTAPLVRHRRGDGEQWVVNTSFESPSGYHAEHYLGAIHRHLTVGTARIVAADGGYEALEPGGEVDAVEMARTLGYADVAALPMFEPLLLCRVRSSGAGVLVCGADDPIAGLIEPPHERVLGWIDRIPVNPRSLPGVGETWAWMRGLVRTLERGSRRHRVALATAGGAGAIVPEFAEAWELGALLDRDPGGAIPAWVDSGGRLHTRDYAPTRHPFDLRSSLEWVAEPARRRDFGRPLPRARALARRGVDAARFTLERPGIAARGDEQPAAQAWLLPDPGRERVPIFSAVHPVTADQLVTREPGEADALGYAPAQLIGYALALAPVTGSLAPPDIGAEPARRLREGAGAADERAA